MKTYHILYEHLGGTVHSPKDPRRVYDPIGAPVPFDETVVVVLSEDDWRHERVRRWTVHLVTLPDWLTPEEWIRDRTSWRWTWGFGCDPRWPENWQRYLRTMTGHPGRRLAITKLLHQRAPKSEFRRSLRERLVFWLSIPPEQRDWDSPFSPKQWGALTNRWVVKAAHHLDKSLYYDRRVDDLGPCWRNGKERGNGKA